MATELEHMIRHAVNDIRNLKHENEVLRAKVEMIDLFAEVFRTEPRNRSCIMAPDVVWELERHLKSAEELREQDPRSDACEEVWDSPAPPPGVSRRT